MNAKIDISNVIIKTERLILRPWTLEDLDDFYNYAKVPGVGEMAGWPHHKSKEESLRILKIFITEKKTFALEYEGKVIGSLGIEEYDENENPELNHKVGRSIGYVLSKDYWNQGLMTEAVKAVLDYCFKELKLDFLVASFYEYNIKSKRVLEKCGFKFYKNKTFKTKTGEEYKGVLMIV
ncbi:MAG: GNAT family N-acetyltransferase [Acholeplasmataceae bacterium]|jgi:ribosomal-protein-alanine N-acetyltransferase|nr:GNAT family N-acetyltransferase [Acholeplasmataceae bacterium]